MEFINFRGTNLEATIVRAGGQEFIIAAIPATKMDSDAARIYSQQKIEIVPGLKVMELATGTKYEVLSRPEGFFQAVQIKDTLRNATPIFVPENELRQNFRFVY